MYSNVKLLKHSNNNKFNSVKIEFLYFDGCPHQQKAYELLLEVLREQKKQQPVQIDRIEIKNDEEAQRHEFLGSPTIRVDGVDIDPSTGEKETFVKACRMYVIDGRLSGVPTKEMIREALERY